MPRKKKSWYSRRDSYYKAGHRDSKKRKIADNGGDDEEAASPTKIYARLPEIICQKEPEIEGKGTLRTLKKASLPLPPNIEGNRVVDLGQLAEMLNDVSSQHRCSKPSVVYDEENVQGLGVSLQVSIYILLCPFTVFLAIVWGPAK